MRLSLWLRQPGTQGSKCQLLDRLSKMNYWRNPHMCVSLYLSTSNWSGNVSLVGLYVQPLGDLGIQEPTTG